MARVVAWRREVGTRRESFTEHDQEIALQIADSKTNRRVEHQRTHRGEPRRQRPA
ncbi:MAG: hypothetical protein GVY30_05585 [Chloroflexi bacterium]|nr:hypothetical protein [Chloroflexota bacterium]